MNPPLRIATERRGPGVVVRLSGEIDLATVPFLRQRLSDAVRRAPHVVVDLTGVSFLSCSGVAALLEARQSAEFHDGALHVAGEHTRLVARVLQILDWEERTQLDRGVPVTGGGRPTSPATT